MKVPLHVRMGAALAGVHARDFAMGWANGMARWAARSARRFKGDLAEVPANTFEPHSVRYAASEAAVTFMREASQ